MCCFLRLCVYFNHISPFGRHSLEVTSVLSQSGPFGNIHPKDGLLPGVVFHVVPSTAVDDRKYIVLKSFGLIGQSLLNQPRTTFCLQELLVYFRKALRGSANATLLIRTHKGFVLFSANAYYFKIHANGSYMPRHLCRLTLINCK